MIGWERDEKPVARKPAVRASAELEGYDATSYSFEEMPELSPDGELAGEDDQFDSSQMVKDEDRAEAEAKRAAADLRKERERAVIERGPPPSGEYQLQVRTSSTRRTAARALRSSWEPGPLPAHLPLSPLSALRTPRSALRSPRSALLSPLSSLPSPLSSLRSPLSALRSPLSALRSPLSALPSPRSLLPAPSPTTPSSLSPL